ncbi:uncharacterized protein [Mytilus edulis]|uniref:uncharacterized protein n=1 Tax=Mytilus edulis TaxID=6550 RepID=UPI0039F0B01A
MTYRCLKHECHGTDYCLIKMDGHEIKSSCHANMHNSIGMCLNHDSVTSAHGCYCNTTECVQKTALHCLGVNCKLTEGCRITQYNGEFQATCHTLHDHDGDCDSDDKDCIPSCNVPLMLDNGHIPCYCESQICADNIQVNVPTTNKPSTTDVPALQQLDPYTCVAETCDKYVSKCNLYELKNQIEGRCMIFPVGELCSPSNDLSVFGGCYCSDSKCVINAITDYNHKHITVPTLAPEYLCEKASCRSDMLCQLYTYQGVATSRCLAFHIGTNCLSYKDVDDTGCICNNAACATNILTEYALNNQVTTTTSTTTESTTPPATTTHSSTTPIMTTATPTTHTTTTPTTATPTPTTPILTTPTTTTSTTTTSTTTIPTMTTPIPITSTMTTPTSTTTTTTTTTPNTTPTTTTPTKTTTATGPRTCHICGDTSLPVPCSSRQIGRDLSHTCKTGENYCMTDIVQDDQGNVDVFKRCVDLATCEKKWITESADLDYCKRYGVVKNPYAFSCHFCCTEDKCNSMLVPNTTTWYTKTN